MNLSAQRLTSFATELLVAAGVTHVQARQWSDALIWANLRGVDTHGVNRILRYVEMIEEGLVKPSAGLVVQKPVGATQVIEADFAPGPIAMNAAVEHALALAATHHIAWCGVRHITHAGAIGYYTEQIALAGYLGIAMTASGPLMVYHGTSQPGVSTNPISIAAPRGDADPLLFDMATSAASMGKVVRARREGTSIPDNWGIDANGLPTTDPNTLAAVLPAAGMKGSGLSLMIEVMTSLLTTNPIIAEALIAGKRGAELGGNGAVVVVDIAAFGKPEDFHQLLNQLSLALKALPKAPGIDDVRLPGERGYSVAKQRAVDGIPIADTIWKQLTELAVKLGVAVPSPN